MQKVSRVSLKYSELGLRGPESFVGHPAIRDAWQSVNSAWYPYATASCSAGIVPRVEFFSARDSAFQRTRIEEIVAVPNETQTVPGDTQNESLKHRARAVIVTHKSFDDPDGGSPPSGVS